MATSNNDYLNELIAKAKKSLEGVNVDSFMQNLRDDSPDKEDAEEELKALEKLKKVIENSSINKEHTKSNINF